MAFCLECFPHDIYFTDYDSVLVSAVPSPALPTWVNITIDNSVQPRKVTLSADPGRPNTGDAGLFGPFTLTVSDGNPGNDVVTDDFSIQVTDIGPPVFLVNVLYEGGAPSTGGISLVLYEGAAPVARVVTVPTPALLNEVYEGASPSTGGISLVLYEGAAPVARTVTLPTFPLINESFEGAAPATGGIVLELYEGASP